MLLDLFERMRRLQVPVTPREWLDLMAALQAGVAFMEPEALYPLVRAVLVKDERHYDRFDRAWTGWLASVPVFPDELSKVIPEDWLRRALGREPSDEDKAKVQGVGSLEELMKQFAQRLAEQHEAHHGGNRWIGTGGTSPFGHSGHHPGGIRVGGQGGGRMAAKVWQQRHFRELAGDAELSPRNLKLALRRLRRFAREGAAEEFDLDGTIADTARDAGLLNVRLRPERRNVVSVLLFLDIGGSMDDHVHAAEALFGAARSEFKRLEHFWFHNFLYERVWRDDRRNEGDHVGVNELIRRHPSAHKVIFVGDASMGPYEIVGAGGSVEHWNEEPGEVWFRRLRGHFRHLVWINPLPVERWKYLQSVQMVRELVEGRMFPLTPDGVAAAVEALR